LGPETELSRWDVGRLRWKNDGPWLHSMDVRRSEPREMAGMREDCTGTLQAHNHVKLNVTVRQNSGQAWERQGAAARGYSSQDFDFPRLSSARVLAVTRSGGKSSANHSAIGTQAGILEHPTRHSVVKWAVPGRESLSLHRRSNALHQDAGRRAAHAERCRSVPSLPVLTRSYRRRTSFVS
jgi:hypothetical protein